MVRRHNLTAERAYSIINGKCRSVSTTFIFSKPQSVESPHAECENAQYKQEKYRSIYPHDASHVSRQKKEPPSIVFQQTQARTSTSIMNQNQPVDPHTPVPKNPLKHALHLATSTSKATSTATVTRRAISHQTAHSLRKHLYHILIDPLIRSFPTSDFRKQHNRVVRTLPANRISHDSSDSRYK